MSDPPSAAEIHAIEAALKMPDGAGPLGEYVRYYYSETDSKSRTVVGMYVQKTCLEFEKIPIPATGMVVVAGERDVPAPWDAGCEVVTVIYAPEKAAHVNARCDSELSLGGYVNGEREMLVFVLVVAFLLVALLGARAIYSKMRRRAPFA